jgi:flavin-dependent dehydrogenase
MSGGSVVSRERLDEAIAQSAVDAGCRFLDGTLALVNPAAGGVRHVRLTRHGRCAQARARTVLIATGLGKSVVPVEGAPATEISGRSRMGAGCRLSPAPAAYARDTVFMAAGAGGYVGIVCVEDGSLNVAAAFDPALVRRVRTPAAAAREVLAESGAPEIHGLADADWQGTARLTRRTLPLAQDRLFFLGDAASYVEPFTGEGIAWALASARAVEPLALTAIERWDPQLTRRWASAHRALIGRRQLVCRALALGLRQPWLIQVGFEILERVPVAARGVMHLLNPPSVQPSVS